MSLPIRNDDATRSHLVSVFSAIAVIEAFTWAGLLVGMYVKHIADGSELGVRVFGSLHGAAFISYVVVTLLLARQLHWPLRWRTLLALAAAVPPFMTVVFQSQARRRGFLSTPQPDQTSDSPLMHAG
jgi:RND superfamily putative drug exporter